jgi:hypothetical protein
MPNGLQGRGPLRRQNGTLSRQAGHRLVEEIGIGLSKRAARGAIFANLRSASAGTDLSRMATGVLAPRISEMWSSLDIASCVKGLQRVR